MIADTATFYSSHNHMSWVTQGYPVAVREYSGGRGINDSPPMHTLIHKYIAINDKIF